MPSGGVRQGARALEEPMGPCPSFTFPTNQSSSLEPGEDSFRALGIRHLLDTLHMLPDTP